jgi:uracil-DNA glycosylase
MHGAAPDDGHAPVDAGDAGDRVHLEPSWKARVGDYLRTPPMQELSAFLRRRRAAGARIYPAARNIFAAFDATPFDAAKVVILGQDPDHGHGQAHGLCFSVQPGVALPPSLVNIFSELQDDLGCPPPNHGCLEDWARQGVLLLNATLTVRAHRAGSHQGKGWETFTDAVIAAVNDKPERVVFVLWGAYARRKKALVDRSRHVVIESAHPSPLSARNGFFGSRPFSRANAALVEAGRSPIDWCIRDR